MKTEVITIANSLLWGKMRVAELSWVVSTCCVLTKMFGKCFVPVSSAACACVSGWAQGSSSCAWTGNILNRRPKSSK